MAMAITLQKYLAHEGIAYDTLPHKRTTTSVNRAHSAHVPDKNVAKSVILEDEEGYIMAIVPADHRIKLGKVRHALNRRMGLATEPELKQLFSDCALGAIPPVGQAYGMETLVDESLERCDDIYMESGNHKELIHLKGSSFRKLMKHSQHVNII